MCLPTHTPASVTPHPSLLIRPKLPTLAAPLQNIAMGFTTCAEVVDAW